MKPMEVNSGASRAGAFEDAVFSQLFERSAVRNEDCRCVVKNDGTIRRISEIRQIASQNAL
jgi:hypothetical protein